MEEQEQKPNKIFPCVEVEVKDILARMTKNEEVEQLRLETDLGIITYRPKKIVVVSEVKQGLKTETSEKRLYKLDEFLNENPMLNELLAKIKKSPQKIIVTYTEMYKTNEENGEEESFMFFYKGQFDTIFYEGFHKDNKENLEKQKEKAEKYKKL